MHIDSTERCSTRIKLAAQFAIKDEAHLIGVTPTGWSLLLCEPGMNDPMLPVQLVDTEAARTRGRVALAAFEGEVRALGVASAETRLVEEEAGLALATHGCCSVLIIVGHLDGRPWRRTQDYLIGIGVDAGKRHGGDAAMLTLRFDNLPRADGRAAYNSAFMFVENSCCDDWKNSMWTLWYCPRPGAGTGHDGQRTASMGTPRSRG